MMQRWVLPSPWRLLLVLLALVLGLFAIALVGSTATACDTDCDGGSAANVDNRALEARAFDWTSVRTGVPRSAGSHARCVYEPLDPTTVPMYVDQLTRRVIPHDAEFYRVSCDGGHWRTGWWVPGRSITSDGAFHDLLQEAVDRLEPDRPELALAPAADARHLVGIPTWLAIDPAGWRTLSTTVTAGIASVRVNLRPSHVEWSVGDGTSHTCGGPGARLDTSRPVAGQQSDCAHTFWSTPADVTGNPAATTFGVGARVVYDADYTLDASGRRSSGGLGRVAGPARVHDVVVREYQAVRIPRS
ncbi:MAG: hypothetical protein WDZ26_05910 [Nitriliruptoraceae bacterium]